MENVSKFWLFQQRKRVKIDTNENGVVLNPVKYFRVENRNGKNVSYFEVVGIKVENGFRCESNCTNITMGYGAGVSLKSTKFSSIKEAIDHHMMNFYAFNNKDSELYKKVKKEYEKVQVS